MGGAPGAGKLAKQLEDGHDRHLLTLELFGNCMPEHQVLEICLAQAVALSGLEVVHQREDALARRRVRREGEGDFA